MKIIIVNLLAICVFFGGQTFAQSQNMSDSIASTFNDYKPVYKKWQANYILDKIEYTKERTIFHFRYVSQYEQGTATYYGPGESLAWFLKNDENPNEVFPMIEIRNIASNKQLKLPVLDAQKSVVFETRKGDVFTCEVHFERLPAHVKKTDFIEGIGAELKTNHFNCLDVEMKTFGSSDLGSEADMIENVMEFEEQTGVAIKTFEEEDLEKKEEQKDNLTAEEREELGVDGVFAKRFVELTNQLRKKGCHCGGRYYRPAKPIEWDVNLAVATKKLVVALWETKGMTTDAGGSSTKGRLSELGVYTPKAYENMSYSFENIEQAFRGWKLTPPQCKRMMDPNVKKIGAARKGKYWSMILIY